MGLVNYPFQMTICAHLAFSTPIHQRHFGVGFNSKKNHKRPEHRAPRSPRPVGCWRSSSNRARNFHQRCQLICPASRLLDNALTIGLFNLKCDKGSASIATNIRTLRPVQKTARTTSNSFHGCCSHQSFSRNCSQKQHRLWFAECVPGNRAGRFGKTAVWSDPI